ncbi:MAG TPA: DHA2 family efflux MFS transporter permease subunit [Desulfobacterales bacterium]|nr:DHA2 family efflux MFS transporter permease subunit [Desulfobacterales bacterium]
MRNESIIARSKWLIFLFVAIGIFMSTLDSSIVNIALPAIMSDFSVDLATIEWVVLVYLLTVSSLLLNFGRLSDIKGQRWVYSRGLILFSVSSLFCGLAENALWLIAARSFQGVGAAMIMACTPALIVETFPVSERGMALGMVGTVVASGLTTGPALGGLLLHLFSWRVIFYVNVPIGILTAVVISRLLRGTHADRTAGEPFDWIGSALLSVSLVCLVLPLSHGYSWGYMSVPTLLFFSVSVLSIIAFLWIEAKISHPVVQLSLFSIRLFTFPVLSAIALFISLFTVVFLMPFYLIHPCGFPIEKVGLLMITPFIFLFFISPVSGTVYDRFGSRILCTVGLAILAFALFSLAALNSAQSMLQIAWRLALAGLGTAMFAAPNSSATMSHVPANHRGLAAGTLATARNLGMVIGVALAGAIFNSTFYALSGGLSLKVYRPELAPIFMSSFRYAMAAGGAVAVIGAVLAFLRGAER